jgi:nucleoside-diphosphate-sugar epimerase
MAEDLFLEEAKHEGRHIVIINPGFMIGGYDTKPSSGQLLLMAYRKPIMVVPQGGKCFVHVEDVALAVVNALTLGRNAEKYIVGAHNKTLAELYKLQKNVCGYKQLLVPIPCWITNMVGMFGDVLRKIGLHTQVCSMNTKQLCVREYYSNAKAKVELKMSETSLERAISDSICWLKRNR